MARNRYVSIVLPFFLSMVAISVCTAKEARVDLNPLFPYFKGPFSNPCDEGMNRVTLEDFSSSVKLGSYVSVTRFGKQGEARLIQEGHTIRVRHQLQEVAIVGQVDLRKASTTTPDGERLAHTQRVGFAMHISPDGKKSTLLQTVYKLKSVDRVGVDLETLEGGATQFVYKNGKIAFCVKSGKNGRTKKMLEALKQQRKDNRRKNIIREILHRKSYTDE